MTIDFHDPDIDLRRRQLAEAIRGNPVEPKLWIELASITDDAPTAQRFADRGVELAESVLKDAREDWVRPLSSLPRGRTLLAARMVRADVAMRAERYEDARVDAAAVYSDLDEGVDAFGAGYRLAAVFALTKRHRELGALVSSWRDRSGAYFWTRALIAYMAQGEDAAVAIEKAHEKNQHVLAALMDTRPSAVDFAASSRPLEGSVREATLYVACFRQVWDRLKGGVDLVRDMATRLIEASPAPAP